MKIVIFSAQKNIYKKESYERKRLESLARRVEEVHVVLMTATKDLENKKIGENLFVYPTNSSNYFMSLFDGIHIGESVIKQLEGSEVVVLGEDAYYTGLVAVRCAANMKKKSIIYVGDDIFSEKYIAESKDHYVRTLAARYVLKRTNAIRVSSKHLKKSLGVILGKYVRQKIYVLPNYLDIEYIRLAPPSMTLRDRFTNFHFIIVLLAPLEKVSNIEAAIYALDVITFDKPRTGLIVVGTGPEKENLKKLAYRLGLDENVVFEDMKKEVVSYLKRADLFLSTQSYTNDNSYLKEAAAAGSAIVTTNTGIATDILKNNESALICDSNDFSCVPDSITKMMKNPILREDLGAQAQEDVMKRYSTTEEEYMNKFIKALEGVVTDNYIKYESFSDRE